MQLFQSDLCLNLSLLKARLCLTAQFIDEGCSAGLNKHLFIKNISSELLLAELIIVEVSLIPLPLTSH